MAELADARDLKSLGPKARPGSIPGLGTIHRVSFGPNKGRSDAPKRRGVEQPGSSLGS